VRLRGAKGQESYWRDYKAVRLQNLYYGGFFQDNLSLTDWVNSQGLTNPLFCLGDGHDGVWNLFEEIGSPASRLEILDWYHLRENLYKVGGSLKRLKQAEAKLWQGQVDEAICASQRSTERGSDFGVSAQSNAERLRTELAEVSPSKPHAEVSASLSPIWLTLTVNKLTTFVPI